MKRTAFTSVTLMFFITQTALGFALYRSVYWLAVPLVLVSSHLMHGMLIGYTRPLMVCYERVAS